MSVEATGDCFEAAYRQAKELVTKGKDAGLDVEPSVRVVHAMVIGEPNTPVAGMRFSHAWVELGDIVFDTTNGRNVVMRRDQYYARGGVEVDRIHRFSWTDAMVAGIRHGHYGPWFECDGECCE